jgi:inward rectifier potassium channel
VITGAYFAVNLLFGTLFWLCGPRALEGGEAESESGRFMQAFFFSVQTLATIGYGGIHPRGYAANLLVTVEALVGLLILALATGFLFARVSRPTASILFSDQAVVGPYRQSTGFMFRIANLRQSQLIEVEATVSLSRLERVGTALVRKFYELPLERKRVVFFPLHWVIVHPIDEVSPLYGLDEEAFRASDPEIFILLTAVDETFSQTSMRAPRTSTLRSCGAQSSRTCSWSQTPGALASTCAGCTTSISSRSRSNRGGCCTPHGPRPPAPLRG